MSRSERQNEKLRAAFSSPDGETAVTSGCANDEEIWAASRGELPTAKVEELLAHSLECPACQESWKVAAMLAEETATKGPATVVPFRGGRRAIVSALGVAAVLALVAILVPLALREQPAESVTSWATGVRTTLWRVGVGSDEPLLGGESVQPGDRIYLTLDTDVAVHVYLINRDQSGESATLFPIDGAQWNNPLPAGSTLRLPGDTSWMYDSWEVSSAGGQESFIVVAAAEPLELLESALAGLDAAGPAEEFLRGEDATAPDPDRDLEQAESALASVLAELATRERVILRRITLENPD